MSKRQCAMQPQNLIVIFYFLTGIDNDHMDGAMVSTAMFFSDEMKAAQSQVWCDGATCLIVSGGGGGWCAVLCTSPS